MEQWQHFWNDNVWGKVIAGVILAVGASIWSAIKFKWWNRITVRWAIKLTMTAAYVSPSLGRRVIL